MTTSRDASVTVRDQHKDALASMPFSDEQDVEDANRGLLVPIEEAVVGADGTVLWDNSTYDFLAGDCPDTVHPSLWRQSQLAAIDGLFEVVPGIYQVRGMDLSNTTLVEGEEGIVVSTRCCRWRPARPRSRCTASTVATGP
ncbi:hypothetical protein [Kribbella sp. NPDC050470]|uniref:hypothetical protein n=1 Tax=unclassified Kribbella TaxID=2644121 RepID=UPI0037A72302